MSLDRDELLRRVTALEAAVEAQQAATKTVSTIVGILDRESVARAALEARVRAIEDEVASRTATDRLQQQELSARTAAERLAARPDPEVT